LLLWFVENLRIRPLTGKKESGRKKKKGKRKKREKEEKEGGHFDQIGASPYRRGRWRSIAHTMCSGRCEKGRGKKERKRKKREKRTENHAVTL